MTHDELGKALQKEKEYVDSLIVLFNSTPDLTRTELKNRHLYISKRVNDIANPDSIELWVTRDCGCCPDCNYYVYPYCDIGGIRVYATPYRCLISAGVEHGCGIEPSERRFDRYKEFEFSDTIIGVIENYLAENPPVYYSEDDDDENEEVEIGE